jgi:hypothetical protein
MHSNKIARSISGALLATAALMLVAACDTMMPKSEPKPMAPIEDTVEVSATVEKIDVAKRLLSLRSEEGDQVTIEVDPAVRNLAQVKVGDRVVARYREAIGASISTTAKSGDPVTVDLAADRAEPGQQPRAQASSTTNIPVTITAVDTKTNLVNFYGEDGLVRAITVETPQAREFIKQLKPGDTVVVTYTEALAISVEPAK